MPVCDNAVVELYGRLPSAKFSHFEATVGFAGDKQTLAIPLRCEKHVIAQGQLHGLGDLIFMLQLRAPNWLDLRLTV